MIDWTAPYYNQPIYLRTEMEREEFGPNDSSSYTQKIYFNQEIMLEFIQMPGDRKSWSDKCQEAVLQFVREHDVLENRVKYTQSSFPNGSSGVGRVWFKCFINKKK